MTGGEVAAVVGGAAVAVAMWVFMFRLDRNNIWPRTWVAAAVLSSYAVASAFALGRSRRFIGPVSWRELLVGAAAGGAWLVATHIGAAALGRLLPAFLDEISDLYGLSTHDTVARMAGPLMAMAVAEELLFRGVVQARAGLIIAVVAYAAVQLVERKWVLVLAAGLGGLVWGELFAWRHGLVAPIVAHAIWTLTLTLVWPIGNAGDATRRFGPARIPR